jgi:hypothetical protein
MTDFEFICNLSSDFFKKTKIQNALNIIANKKGKKNKEITGWETWWQIEFASFLETYDKITEWNREVRVEIDKKTTKKRSNMIVDFEIRKKHSQHKIFLELKQHSSPTTCVNNMMLDADKVWAGKPKDTIYNSFFCIGIHKGHHKKDVIKEVKDKVDKAYLDMHFGVFTKKIPKTDLHCTIF